MLYRRVRLIWALILVAGCAVYSRYELDERYGPADPARYDRVPVGDPSVDFWRDVKPVLDSRCVVCHGCYDAPCQLQTTSYEGVTRGANKDTVYDSRPLDGCRAEPLVRRCPEQRGMAQEGILPGAQRARADATSQSRGQRTVPNVGDEAGPPGAKFRSASARGRRSIPDTAQYCPKIEEFDRFEREHPGWGMPYGLPPVSAREHATLVHWLEAGAPYREPEPLTPALRAHVEQWEAFLNGDSVKEQLASRYIYEHGSGPSLLRRFQRPSNSSSWCAPRPRRMSPSTSSRRACRTMIPGFRGFITAYVQFIALWSPKPICPMH